MVLNRIVSALKLGCVVASCGKVEEEGKGCRYYLLFERWRVQVDYRPILKTLLVTKASHRYREGVGAVEAVLF